MIKFVTAILNAGGEIVGSNVGDLPMPAGLFLEGHTFVSVAVVVAKEEHQRTLAHRWRETLRAADGGVVMADGARAFVNSIIASPTTETDIAAAPKISPIVGHWLKRCAAPGAALDDKIVAAMAERPSLAATIDSLHARRHAPTVKQGFRVFEARAQSAAAAASAWQDMTAAIEAAPEENA